MRLDLKNKAKVAHQTTNGKNEQIYYKSWIIAGLTHLKINHSELQMGIPNVKVMHPSILSGLKRLLIDVS